MHELPKDLSTSLKSYRGSIYGSNRGRREADLEKGDGHGPHDGSADDEESPPPSEPKESSSMTQANGATHGGKENQRPGASSKPATSSKHNARQSSTANSKGGGPKQPQEKKSSDEEMSIFQGPPVEDPDPAAERLAEDETPLSDEDFHRLIGMRRPEDVSQQREEENYPFKLAVKGGLYHVICSELRWIQYKYRIFDVATYVLLALQVVIGAVFIILGALRSERIYVAIAVLGAISTAIGGVLSLMKGQGLPNRLRQARDQMRNVVFEAQELFWDFRSGRPIIYSDIKKIREDYLRVLEELRRNHPDTWTNAASQAAKAHRGRGTAGRK